MRRARSVVQTLGDPADPVDPRVDLVELRIDLYEHLDVAAFVASCPKPVIATVRRKSDGGRFSGNDDDRRRLLANASGAAYVDVELDAPSDLAPPGPKRIVSHHDLHGVPDDLDGLHRRCVEAGADLVKIVVTPADAVAAFRVLGAGVAMGRYGAFTRVLAPLTYCAVTEVAPGMPTPDDLFDVFRIERLSLVPAVYGVAGDPIEHSRGPHIHNAAFARDGLDAVYLRFPVVDLVPFWRAFLDHGGCGLSVTAPLKQQAAALAAHPSSEVRLCGAANTLLPDGRAFNTDYQAFLELLPVPAGEAVVLGAGGAARAAVAALRTLGWRVQVWARDPARAAALGVPVAAAPGPAPVVVNTTPLEPPDAPFVIDLRYGPDIAPPVSGVDGLTFLHAQARHQYRLFTGREL